MKISCSVGLGEMDAQDCLKCALETRRPPCGFDYALLKAIYASNDKPERTSEIHVTDLTGCPLRAYWDKKDPSPERPHEMLVRWMGSGFHGMVEGKDEHLDSELSLEYDGITGRSDIVYKDGRLVDLKFTRWMYPSKLPYGSHMLQVNIYAWMLRKQGREIDRLQIQYIDATGPTKCRACRVVMRVEDGNIACPKCGRATKEAHLGVYLVDIPLMTDAEVEEAIGARKESLQFALSMGTPPDREPGYLCGFCSHYDRCMPELAD